MHSHSHTRSFRGGIQLELQEPFMQMPRSDCISISISNSNSYSNSMSGLLLAKMEYFSHVNSFTFNSRIKFVTYIVLIMHANLSPPGNGEGIQWYPTQQVSPLSVRFTSDCQLAFLAVLPADLWRPLGPDFHIASRSCSIRIPACTLCSFPNDLISRFWPHSYHTPRTPEIIKRAKVLAIWQHGRGDEFH